MATRSLKIRIFISYLTVILVLALLIGFLGYCVIKKDIIDRTQQEVSRNLVEARSFYNAEINRLGEMLALVASDGDMKKLKEKLDVDYAFSLKQSDLPEHNSKIAKLAYNQHVGVGGTRIIKAEELSNINASLLQGLAIEIKPTPKAKPIDKSKLQDVMAKEYAMPILAENGEVENIICVGRIINKDYALVDRIKKLVFGEELYNSKPVGTVTIFQNDVRVATNVLDLDGNRAIGTRVSEEVYREVVEHGKVWHDRAFVVTDWYKTAYEPIRDVTGKIVGILYVGMLEEPFNDMAKRIGVYFILIIAGAVLLALIMSLFLAFRISKPLTDLMSATGKLASGNFNCIVNTGKAPVELEKVFQSFNNMSVNLKEREESLKISNGKLLKLNKAYIDLIGFVAHELKGILASAVINAYSVRDGYLGMINFKQQKAIDSVARNLDYLTATVKKFLNLGRIEKGDITLSKHIVELKKDIFDVSIGTLATLAKSKEMVIENLITPEMKVDADLDQMLIVSNNLINNAIKYGVEKGRICISALEEDGKIRIEIYNDSEPIAPEQLGLLFKKFSRLKTDSTRIVKGTGLGLYITKEIIEKHGGKIWVEPRENGNSFIFEIERN